MSPVESSCCVEELGEVASTFRAFALQCEVAEALIRVGRIGQGLSVVESALAGETEERLGVAELLRLKGELLLLQGAPGPAETAEDQLRHAPDCARRQGALSWELRAATSLARLLRAQAGRPSAPRSCSQCMISLSRGSTPQISKRRKRSCRRS